MSVINPRLTSLRLDRGVDFDDAEYGFKEEDKEPMKVFLHVSTDQSKS